jgi:hypothetical protein
MYAETLQRIDVAVATIQKCRKKFFQAIQTSRGWNRRNRAATYQLVVERALNRDEYAELFLELGANVRSAKQLRQLMNEIILLGTEPSAQSANRLLTPPAA